MVPALLFEFTSIDLDQVMVGPGEIERVNPHRGAMRQLDGIIWHDDQMMRAIAYRDVHGDEFWVAGHIPGRPILPGVLMVEAGAQLASYMTMRHFEDITFLGFVGCDDAKFRGLVVPGDRLLILGAAVKLKRRRSICQVQGVVNGNIVFEAKITGMPL